MKTLLTMSLFLLLSICSFAQKYSISDLIGKWEGKDATGKVGGFEIRDESESSATSKTLRLTANGTTHTCKYVADFTKDPIWFDIIALMADGTQKTLTGLLEVVDHSTLKWKISKSSKRFGDFVKNNGQDFMLMHRKE